MSRRHYFPIVCTVSLVLLSAPLRADPMRPTQVGFCRTLTPYGTCRIHSDFPAVYLARTDHTCRGGGNCTVYVIEGRTEQVAYDIDVHVEADCAPGTASFRHWDPREEAWLPASEVPGYFWHSFYARKVWTPDARLYHADDPVWRFTCDEARCGVVLIPYRPSEDSDGPSLMVAPPMVLSDTPPTMGRRIGDWLVVTRCDRPVHVPTALEIWMDSE